MKKPLFFILIALMVLSINSCKQNQDKVSNEKYSKPLFQPENEKKEGDNPDKTASWTPEQAAHHQKILAKLTKTSKRSSNKNALFGNTYANGTLDGEWINRGPKNMPGAFKFAEMLDGTDVMYAVTWNHYSGEYNSKSYIYKGTVYNPTTGTGGDDFKLLTANWPNRYQNLFAFQLNGNIRLVAHIENGPVYYSDNDGQTWTLSSGLPFTNTSSAINRQNNNTIYVTDNKAVYISTDFGINFSLLKNFGTSQNSFLYTPRYTVQDGANNVYLARNGSFYKLNATNTDFNFKGSYTSSHPNVEFSIGGDSSVLYVTADKNYWVSTNNGVNWTQKFPNGNWYGDTSGKMDPGKFFAAHPENPRISIGGYAMPIVSTNTLNTTISDATGWGRYQNGTNLSPTQYQNRIRFNYHPDFQSSHFFYNSSGNLFSARCSDGGIFISYKEWFDFPPTGRGYNNSGYANAHFININVLNTITPLVYRESLFTGIKNPDHIHYGTQDQGSQSIIPGTSGDVLDFYQVIGGDGPSIDSYDGLTAWKWNRQGDKVWSPVNVYSSRGQFQSIGAIDGQFNSSKTVDFNSASDMGWVQTYIDRHDPNKRIWMLSKNLHRAEWVASKLKGHTVDKGDNQVAALAQATVNPNKIYMLQDGKVFISNNRGNTFEAGRNTPFSKTPGGWTKGDIGSGIVLPGNDNWVLFSGPSNNNVGSILSTNGGNTWIDVTGSFPAGVDAQTGGMVVTPDGKFIFSGTDMGPYVFNVAQKTWYSIAKDIGFFNTVDVDYITSTNTVRFATFGSGILDFNINNNALTLGSEKQNNIPNQIKMYPNPSSNYVMIALETTEASNITVDIINTGGQKVLSKKHTFNANIPLKLNISALSSGVYVAKFTNTKNQTKALKLIVK